MSKLYRPGVSKVIVCPAVAGVSPTRGEINAGTDISLHVSSMPGFNIDTELKEAANLGETFVPTVAAARKASSATIRCWDDDAVTTVRTVLAPGTTTNLVRMPYGDVPTKRCEVWRIKAADLNDSEWGTSDLAAFDVKCAVLSSPTLTGVIPA